MAKKTTTNPAPDKGDAYYAELEASKVAAGLSLEQARAVTARQREWDKSQTTEEAEAEAPEV